MTTIDQESDIPEKRITPKTESCPDGLKRKPFAGLAGRLKHSRALARDAVEVQREMRDEW